MWLKVSHRQDAENTSAASPLIWPRDPLLWLFFGPWLCLCAEETHAGLWLPADRTHSWTRGWMPAHQAEVTGACTGHRKVWSVCVCVCVCVCVGLSCHWIQLGCVCVFPHAAFYRQMRIKSTQPREVWINRSSWQADASAAADSRSVDDLSWVNICVCGCVWVCVCVCKTPLLLAQRYKRVFEARLTFKMWIFKRSETVV